MKLSLEYVKATRVLTLNRPKRVLVYVENMYFNLPNK